MNHFITENSYRDYVASEIFLDNISKYIDSVPNSEANLVEDATAIGKAAFAIADLFVAIKEEHDNSKQKNND
jgi:hypothetical protein